MLAWQSQVLDGLHLVHLLRDLHLPDQAADQGLLGGAVATKLDTTVPELNIIVSLNIMMISFL